MKKAVIALGSNMEERRGNIERAVSFLSNVPGTKVLRLSPVYETLPVDMPGNSQKFLNAVCEIETDLSPYALLGACLGIEAAMGRVRGRSPEEKLSRPIDLDVLLIEGYSSDDPELTLPHPRMAEREFVLCPLADLFPDGKVYGGQFIIHNLQ
jgi:2-amino-4-hydroxy-6-hydroxymethyldihydropteridine diphosphokinase